MSETTRDGGSGGGLSDSLAAWLAQKTKEIGVSGSPEIPLEPHRNRQDPGDAALHLAHRKTRKRPTQEREAPTLEGSRESMVIEVHVFAQKKRLEGVKKAPFQGKP